MYTLACRDLGMDCDHLIQADTKEEVKQAAFAHAGEIHADVLQSMNTPEQMADMEKLIMSKIK